MSAAEALVQIENVSHYYGKGALKKQILFDVTESVRAGEIIILTGPSGSGKTTLLTLIGALRSTQEGSLKVLGHELLGASEADLVRVRQRIGYIFQAHNLIEALSATQNVQMSLSNEKGMDGAKAKRRAVETLEAVGLGERVDHFPGQLSGGQKQRVAIARALASRPQLILADEPTASLDKKSGRDVVDMMQTLAREQDCAVVLVTHDNRILDIADRIIHLEDGRLAPYVDAVKASTQNLLSSVSQSRKTVAFLREVEDLSAEDFAQTLEQMTNEAQGFLDAIDMANDDAFGRMLERVLTAFTLKIGQVLNADRSTLFLIDEDSGELWSKVAQGAGEAPLDIRIPMSSGIAGHVATTGEGVNIPDVYDDERFNPEVDKRTGYRTRCMLCQPIRDLSGRPFAVAQILNRLDGEAFDRADEGRFEELSGSIGVLLETWWRMSQRQKSAATTAEDFSPAT